MNEIQKWLQFFENVSCFFREFLLNPLWNKYNNHTDNIWDSLAIFLEAYAFEHQQRKPDYAHAAVDALDHYKKKNKGIMNQDASNKIWEHFKKLLSNQGLNHQNNPLCPLGTSYESRYQGRIHTTRQLSAIQLVSDIQNDSLTIYLVNKIVKDGIEGSHKLLKSIQGVNNKIASLFLRDLTYTIETNLSKTKNRHLLQPIDIWLRRTIRTLTNNQEMSDSSVANWIVCESGKNKVNPELINMGIWYFGAQVATSEYRLNKALNDIKYANNLWDEHQNRFKNVCQNCL